MYRLSDTYKYLAGCADLASQQDSTLRPLSPFQLQTGVCVYTYTHIHTVCVCVCIYVYTHTHVHV